MIINLLSQDLQSVSKNTKDGIYVTFSFSSEGKDKKVSILNKDLNKRLDRAVQTSQITGKKYEVAFYKELSFEAFNHVLVLGLGDKSELEHEVLRQAIASAYEAFKSLKSENVFIDLNTLNLKKEKAEYVKTLVEGLELASYEFTELKSKPKEKSKKKEEGQTVHILLKEAKSSEVKKAFEEGLILAKSVNFSRYLGDMPGNKMTPEILAQKTLEAIKGTKIKATVWNKARIIKEKMGGLLGVSLGSSQEPRFIILEYNGAAKSKKPVVFVGKGLTFDSGGISLKPSASMEEMKYDMCGGANVIGTLIAIAKLGLKVNAIGLIPSSENMPGPSATKPGDVLTCRNGKTFEVNNTDAEGRLILSDALAYATEQKPEVIIDAATLTGAMVVALGNLYTGYFTRYKQLKDKIEVAGKKSGEWVWNMPLCDFHVQDMKGTYADLSNMSSSKGAGSSTAAAFLEQFVGEDIPWAHFDIAGTGWAVGSRIKYCTRKGASGAMVRTFVEIAKSYEK
ncbi:MAG: leucyl aminopeptidase [Bdellovibrionales bacterium]|nr:leucyl aminopeptidase [Bdellovibrionales bacterium]